MYQFLYDEVVPGTSRLTAKFSGELEEYNELLTTARKQMEGENFTRMLLYLNLPVESKETYDFLSAIYEETGKYYDNSRVYLVGESSNALDLSSTFTRITS